MGTKITSKTNEFQSMEGEEWRKIPYLPPHIEISSMGRLRQYVTPTELKLMPVHKNQGYLNFSYGGSSYIVHRVVADVFLTDSKDNGNIVKHKNGIKDDNRVDNLEWANPYRNLKESFVRGADSRRKIYCKELDKVFGSLYSACVLTGLPQALISYSLKTGETLVNHTFKYVEIDDKILTDHNIFYIDAETSLQIYLESNSIEEARKKIFDYLGEGLKPYSKPQNQE